MTESCVRIFRIITSNVTDMAKLFCTETTQNPLIIKRRSSCLSLTLERTQEIDESEREKLDNSMICCFLNLNESL